MCATCGCSTDHDHSHDHDHPHDHKRRLISLEQNVLAKNDRLAAQNRGAFAALRLTALNLVSSPGSGKTTLLERTIRDLSAEIPISVIEGDQATTRDADRIRAAGARAVQIETGAVCHLDAAMIARALAELAPPAGSILAIENVGNLVCPAMFDLGEAARVVVCSVTEGDDKPAKYPHMFRSGDLLLVNKVDLLPHVGDFDPDRLVAHARALNPRIRPLLVSARTGEGMSAWYDWLRARRADAHAPLRISLEAAP